MTIVLSALVAKVVIKAKG